MPRSLITILKVNDWRVKENSTVTYSVGGLILSNSGAVTANYWLSQIYDKEIADAHRNADMHIHDLSMLTGYCAGWSLKQFIKKVSAASRARSLRLRLVT
jgi:anaerobic ribonucleoside-triphosphate reductase